MARSIMAHHTVKGAYRALVARLNRFPQGAPPEELLYRILEMLFSEREASLVASLPIKPFTVDAAARIWKVPRDKARATLDELASRGLILDMIFYGEPHYALPPPMAGFFEFSFAYLRYAPSSHKYLKSRFLSWARSEF
jgi:hypothetical protein